MLLLPNKSTFEIDWESLAACFRQVTKSPANTRHADIAPALLFITRNKIEPLDVAAVVAAMPVGRRTLERRFEKHLGVSVRRAITLVRLEFARQLLCRTGLTITEISVEVGFSSSSKMANVFLRGLRICPREIRRGRSNGAAKTLAPEVQAPAAHVLEIASHEKPAPPQPTTRSLSRETAHLPTHDVWRAFLSPLSTQADHAEQPASFIIVGSGESPAEFVAPGEVWREIAAPGEVIDARSEATASATSRKRGFMKPENLVFPVNPRF